MIPIDFQVTCSKVKPICCPLYIFESFGYLLCTGFASTEKINVNFAPRGGIDVSETFLVYFIDFVFFIMNVHFFNFLMNTRKTTKSSS